MLCTFETRDYGTIEIDTETREAYFARTDMLANLDEDGEFRDWTGRTFRFIGPVGPRWPDGILQVTEYHEIGRTRPQPVSQTITA